MESLRDSRERIKTRYKDDETYKYNDDRITTATSKIQIRRVSGKTIQSFEEEPTLIREDM